MVGTLSKKLSFLRSWSRIQHKADCETALTTQDLGPKGFRIGDLGFTFSRPTAAVCPSSFLVPPFPGSKISQKYAWKLKRHHAAIGLEILF